MHHPSAYHIGYADGASRWTQNLASAAWAIYTPSHVLLHSSGICLGSATNNQAKYEYDVIIGLLAEASHYHIHHLSILLDSQLSSCNSTMYIMFTILASFTNTCKLDYYLTTLIQSHLHIFQDNIIK
jgi:ribonuclease HI